MLSYKNDTKLKEDFIKEIKWHEETDKFIKGTYSKGTKGCAVGCLIKSLNKLNGTKLQANNHKAYEKYLGLPEWLARLEDTIFENLPETESKKWPLKFSQAIPVGVDLEPVKWKFCAYLIRKNIKRIKGLENLDENVREQVIGVSKQVLKVHNEAIKTNKWDESARSAAESAAWSAVESAWSAVESAVESARSAAWSAESAVESAAWSAVESAAESAARSAVESARSAAWSAVESAVESARSAAWSAAESAAWSAAHIKHSKKLLTLLKEQK